MKELFETVCELEQEKVEKEVKRCETADPPCR